MVTQPMQGMTVVVIGGSSGIGLATARAALDAGADVVITGRSKERLDDAASSLGAGVRTVCLDSADEDGTKAMFGDLPVVHHIFVSAATVGSAAITTETEQLRPLLESRVWGSVFAAKHGAPRMTVGGSITFCSGVSALRPRPGGSSVSAASAAAVEALARSLAVELAPIRVNAVVPGLIDTPMVSGMFGDKHDQAMQSIGASLPVRRVGQAEDIADGVLFLMGNGYVTGISLVIDGGRLLV